MEGLKVQQEQRQHGISKPRLVVNNAVSDTLAPPSDDRCAVRAGYRLLDKKVTAKFASKADALQHFELHRLMRTAFYDSLGRRPPTAISQMPSYVRAVKKHWELQFSNSARRLLAQVEGFDSWEEMMSTEEWEARMGSCT